MPEPTICNRADIIDALNEIKDPCSVANGTPMGLGEMGLIGELDMTDNGAVSIMLRLTSPFCHMIGFFKQEADRRLMALPGVTSVVLRADNGLDWTPELMNGAAQQLRMARLDHMNAMPA